MRQSILLIAILMLLPVSADCNNKIVEQPVWGQVSVEVHVKREDGIGTCGSQPWGVDHISGGDFNCPPPKYWYGYHLVAYMNRSQLKFIPMGEDAWQIVPVSEKVKGVGQYLKAEHWSDGKRVCSPAAIAPIEKLFPFEVAGDIRDKSIHLRFIAMPEEKSKWVCSGGHSYERRTSLLLIDWAVAMTGDYKNLTATLSGPDRAQSGLYTRHIAESMNPSPENRDFATVEIKLECLNPKNGDTLACPWE